MALDSERSLAEVHVAWIDAGLPRISTECNLLWAREHIVDDAGLANMCWDACPPGNCPGKLPNESCPRGCAAGCYVTDNGRPTAVIHETQKKWSLIRHEMLHYLSSCAGLGWDIKHENDDVWALDK